jgi:mRNA interferase RelE/StbE
VRWSPCTVIWPDRTKTALAELAARDPRLAARIVNAVDRYAATGQGDVVRLHGRSDYRLRVGSWRVIFDLDQSARRVVVTAVEPRREAYRRR